MSITELQRTIWESCGDDSAATQNIRKNSLAYYVEYRQRLKETHSFIESETKIQNLMLISYFISEKSEVLYDVQGNKMTNIALSINQLAKKHSDYKEFFFHMKQMMRTVTLPDQAKQSEEEINFFMKYFSFVMTFYNKFLITFDKITICHNIHNKDLEGLGGQKGYTDRIKYLLWVIYISFRKVAFNVNMDTIGNTCLLVCLFSYYVRQIYKQEKVTSIYAPDIVQDLGTFPSELEQIQSVWLNFFYLKDMKTYGQIRNAFLTFIETFTQKMAELKHPFSPKTILFNTKKFQQFYHKNMVINQIDETLFLNNLASNQQNIRFTAFGARKKVNKYNTNNLLQCKRALNYESQIKIAGNNNTEEKERNGKGNFVEIMKKIKASQTPVMLIKATPLTQFATAYNWLHEKSLNLKQNQETLDLKKLLQIGYENNEFQPNFSDILSKRKLIQGLFFDFLNEFEEENQQNVNVVSILTLEVFSYVMNITNRQISDMVEILNVSWFSVWEGIDKMLNYDKTMPNNVKTHLLLLQTSIVSTYIWKESSFIDSLEEVELSEEYTSFFYRILHHIAYQMSFICKDMSIPDAIMDQAFIVCQYFLKECSSLMRNINLDIIMMCSIFGVCRARNVDIKFKSIMSAYKSVNNMDDKAFRAIEIIEHFQEKPIDIIRYYNTGFLPYTKAVLMKVKEQKLEKEQFINSANYILSPVKSIIPSLTPRGTINNTPTQSMMLIAYNESPLLKKNKQIFINFQDTNKQNMSGMNNHTRKLFNQTQILRERSNNVSQMLQKKFGSNKPSTLIPKGYHPKQV